MKQELFNTIKSDQFLFGLLIILAGENPMQQVIALETSISNAGANPTIEQCIESFKSHVTDSTGLVLPS